MGDRPYNRVEDLSLEQLREEVWYWRSEAAAGVWMLTSRLKAAAKDGPTEDSEPLEHRLKAEVSLLQDAMRGDYHPTCEACGQAVKPGQAVVDDANGGELHAACVADDGQDVLPGAAVAVDPAGVDHEGPGDPPAALTTHASGETYTHDGLVEWLSQAEVLLADLGADSEDLEIKGDA